MTSLLVIDDTDLDSESNFDISSDGTENNQYATNNNIQKLKMAEWEADSCVRGYHLYESIWTATLNLLHRHLNIHCHPCCRNLSGSRNLHQYQLQL